MSRFIYYQSGQVLGNNGVVYLSDSETRFYNGHGIRYGNFKCKCGKIFQTSINKVKSGHTTSCGCYIASLIGRVNFKHGLSNHRLWYKWNSIKNRIFDPNVIEYKHYGGRGIKLYEPWINDAKSFIDYCMTLKGYDDSKLTLDRIDNDGNYEPGNLRFTTKNIQTRNRRILKANTSGYVGVSYDITHKEWQSYIYDNRKKITIYRGNSKIEAIEKRENYIIENQLIGYKLNLK